RHLPQSSSHHLQLELFQSRSLSPPKPRSDPRFVNTELVPPIRIATGAKPRGTKLKPHRSDSLGRGRNNCALRHHKSSLPTAACNSRGLRTRRADIGVERNRRTDRARRNTTLSCVSARTEGQSWHWRSAWPVAIGRVRLRRP